jgi:two-component system sensor histidine kinase DesK
VAALRLRSLDRPSTTVTPVTSDEGLAAESGPDPHLGPDGAAVAHVPGGLARVVEALIVAISLGVLVAVLRSEGGGEDGHGSAFVAVALVCTVAVAAVTLLNARAMLGQRTWLAQGPRLALQAVLAYLPAVALGLEWLSWAAGLAAVLLGLLPRKVGVALAGALLIVQVTAYGLSDHRILDPAYAGFSFVASTLLLYGVIRSVAVTVELARARAELARVEVLQERLRMSRDLHDLLGRSVAAISLKTELALRYRRRGADDRVQAELEQVLALSHQAGADLRALVSGYRALSLATELGQGCTFLRDAGVRCEEELSRHPLPTAVDEAAAWVARESLTNVLKHSDATYCRVRGDVQDDVLTLEVVNDGARPPAEGAGAGTGLVGVLERVETLGGSASATRSQDGTFTLRVTVPLTGRAAGSAGTSGAWRPRRVGGSEERRSTA